jgi:serine/threonine protein phosphatase 1
MNSLQQFQACSVPRRSPSGWKRLFTHRKRQAATVPEGVRVYAIGDVHGRLDLLKVLWELIQADARATDLGIMVVFLGDYVDRGFDSKGVIDFLLSARLNAGEIVFLRGNHDQSVLDFIADAEYYRVWKPFGAAPTLLSYGVLPPRFEDAKSLESARQNFLNKCPPQHIRFFNTLSYSHVIGDYLFAHAGVRPGVPLDRQDPKDLMWIREEFLDSREQFKKTVVHGHSPMNSPVQCSNRIGLDTGAYATGCLTAAVLEGMTCRFLST